MDVCTAANTLLVVVMGNSNVYQHATMQSNVEKKKIKIAKGADPRSIQSGSGKVLVVTSDFKLRMFSLPGIKLKTTIAIEGIPSTIHISQGVALIATGSNVYWLALDTKKMMSISMKELGICRGAVFNDQRVHQVHDPFYVLSEIQEIQKEGTIHVFVWIPDTKQYANVGCIARNIPAPIWKGMHVTDTGQIVVACADKLQVFLPYAYTPEIRSK